MARHSGTWHLCIVSQTITFLSAMNSDEVLQMEHSSKETNTSMLISVQQGNAVDLVFLCLDDKNVAFIETKHYCS